METNEKKNVNKMMDKFLGMARNVSFLNRDEILMYAFILYDAQMWADSH